MVFSEAYPTTAGVVSNCKNIIFLFCCWIPIKALQRLLNLHGELLWEVHHGQLALQTELSWQETQSSKPRKCLIFQNQVISNCSTTPFSSSGKNIAQGKEKMFLFCPMPLLTGSLNPESRFHSFVAIVVGNIYFHNQIFPHTFKKKTLVKNGFLL